jgi:hypothetical protein
MKNLQKQNSEKTLQAFFAVLKFMLQSLKIKITFKFTRLK